MNKRLLIYPLLYPRLSLLPLHQFQHNTPFCDTRTPGWNFSSLSQISYNSLISLLSLLHAECNQC